MDERLPFCAEYAKTGAAKCKKCKEKLPKSELRVGTIVANPFSDAGGDMKQWYHLPCIFEKFSRARATTRKIECPEDIDGWDDLKFSEKEAILKYLPGCSMPYPRKPDEKTPPKKDSRLGEPDSSKGTADKSHKDHAFREFRRLCAELANESSYLGKTALVKDMLTKGSDKNGFKGDLFLWVRFLAPAAAKRVYNIQSKQLVKLFSRVFVVDTDEMIEDLEQGDVAETVRVFFEKSDVCLPSKKSTLTLQEVDKYLERLSKLTKEEDQVSLFKELCPKCTSNDLKMIVRLIKHDLRINAGPKHILEAIHAEAYQGFQSSRDLRGVLNKVIMNGTGPQKVAAKLGITVSLMTPVLPMLAEACTSVEYAMKKCSNGMYAEVKYDGERVQVHKKGNEFRYFSRSLKPVVPHKVNHFADFIPKAFPHGKDLILDSEVLLVDNKTGQPLPFGTLGAHKKTAFKDASVCLFIFDCIYYNDEILTDKPMFERRRILNENMKEVKNHIMFSEMEEIHDPDDLTNMIVKVLNLGLEGLVLKDLSGKYEPGKRHWLKVKKDYLNDGAMADTADLVVLGAWYGTGNKGGMMSVFLMGCYNPANSKWCTVTKVHTGHDDKTLKKLQTELDVVKISKDPAKVPSWLKCNKPMIPDFVAADPKNMPVWEITGAEFTQNVVHTAEGISVRFPRVTRIRSDKTWKESTSLPELKALFEKSRSQDFSKLMSEVSPTKKGKANVKSPRKPASDKNETASDRSSGNESEPIIPAKRPKLDLRNPLPSTFRGISLVLPDSLPDVDKLKRYFIAYDGEVLKCNDFQKATHAIYAEGQPVLQNKLCPSAVPVDVSWLWDSIKKESLQSPNHYKLKKI